MKSFVGKDMADYFDVLETLKLQNSLTKYDVKKFIEQYKNIKHDEIRLAGSRRCILQCWEA